MHLKAPYPQLSSSPSLNTFATPLNHKDQLSEANSGIQNDKPVSTFQISPETYILLDWQLRAGISFHSKANFYRKKTHFTCNIYSTWTNRFPLTLHSTPEKKAELVKSDVTEIMRMHMGKKLTRDLCNCRVSRLTINSCLSMGPTSWDSRILHRNQLHPEVCTRFSTTSGKVWDRKLKGQVFSLLPF